MDKTITARDVDYSQWYLDVIAAAGLADYTPVRGCMVIKPYGYALWERVQQELDAQFKKTGVQNAYFPMLIPQKLLEREADHVEGFAPEVAVVTHAGNEKLDEPLVIRPTSETIMYEIMRDWVQSYRDLPLLVNQWTNVVRWEKRTRLFLRTTEFLWQEGHTIHRDFDDADSRARMMLNIYDNFARDIMAIATIPGVKAEHEKFAGAHTTYTLETMMQDGKALQFSTSHNLGDNFARAFNITFLDSDGEKKYAWQTSWGLSTRSIGALIMSHSDDRGLVLPPRMASVPVVVVPIYANESDRDSVVSVAKSLSDAGGYILDDRDYLRPGEKYYEWEKKGVPIRIEIGPKDIAKNSCVVVRRDTGAKEFVDQSVLLDRVSELLDTIQNDLLAASQQRLLDNTVVVDTWDEFVQAIEAGKFVLAHWDRSVQTADSIKTETAATVRCIPFDHTLCGDAGVCIKTGNYSVGRVVFAKNY